MKLVNKTTQHYYYNTTTTISTTTLQLLLPLSQLLSLLLPCSNNDRQ